MVQVTGVAQKQAWIDRTFPAMEQVAPLVWSIPVACAHFPVRYTFSYVVANDPGEFIVIDPGWSSTTGHAQLQAGFRNAGLDATRMTGVFVTHFHPDHLGAAHELAEEHGAWLGLHPRETEFFAAQDGYGHLVERDAAWIESCGIPPEMGEKLAMTEERIRNMYPGLSAVRTFEDNELLPLPGRKLRAVWTPGHTAGHLCVVDEDSELVFSGDHVLPRITPNIGADSHDPDRDALSEYLDSLSKIAKWDEFEVCPAHEYRFQGLAQRAQELAEHHQTRNQEVRQVLSAEPNASVWDVASQLSWSRGWASLDGDNLRSALAETRSHLNHIAAGARI